MHTAGEAAHVVLMREHWTLVPDLLRIAQRTMSTVCLNIVFTLAYNAGGLLQPIVAAAQSLRNIGGLANSGRLIGQQ